ncbi:MAG: ATP-binding protein [bacterium]
MTIDETRIITMPEASIDDLKKVIGLSELSDEVLQWIFERSTYHVYQDGDILVKTGASAEIMWMLAEGKVDYYSDVNGQLVYYLSFENDRMYGGITGLLPHSRMKVYGGTSIAVGVARVYGLHREHFAELEKLAPDFIQRLIGYMTERARLFATIQLQREKVSALGKLSAGIAHEMNNPAAAINRISSELKRRLQLNYELTSLLVGAKIEPEVIAKLESFAHSREEAAGKSLSAIERMNIEDEISDWFSDNGYSNIGEIAESLAEYGYTKADLANINQSIAPQSFISALRWLENLLSSNRLIKDLEEASSRISHLVGAIKSHVHMDRTTDAQKTNIHTDIDNTLTLLGYKLRDKNITVIREFDPQLPEVDAYIGELNQVWTNIIDNAIDAVERNGTIAVSTHSNGKDVTIKLVDNGSGIPTDIISRIFDPFFTTKKVGQGTGIGLDVVKRIIDRHHGVIKVDSVPGRTEFNICIPIVHSPEKI